MLAKLTAAFPFLLFSLLQGRAVFFIFSPRCKSNAGGAALGFFIVFRFDAGIDFSPSSGEAASAGFFFLALIQGAACERVLIGNHLLLSLLGLEEFFLDILCLVSHVLRCGWYLMIFTN